MRSQAENSTWTETASPSGGWICRRVSRFTTILSQSVDHS